jgi:hypothetical protein
MTPAYVVNSPESVYLNKNSTEISTSHAIIIINTKAGITPSTLSVAGIDIIPAPIILVDTLNTAPCTDARFSPSFLSGRSGARIPVAGDIPGGNLPARRMLFE